MSTTITSLVGNAPTKGSRLTATTSDGTNWVVAHDATNNLWTFWYSYDEGATWEENVSARITDTTSNPKGALFIDIADRMWFVCATTRADLRRMLTPGPSSVWDAGPYTLGGINPTSVDLVAFPKGAGLDYLAVVLSTGAEDSLSLSTVEFNNANSYLGSEQNSVDSTSLNYSMFATLDFQHTGDGVTPESGEPHLFVLYRDATYGRARVAKIPYAPTSQDIWGNPVITDISDGTSAFITDGLASIFDGSQFVMTWFDNSTDQQPKVKERDAANTTTTVRTPPLLLDGVIRALSISHNEAKDIYLYAIASISGDLKRCIYNRVEDSWGGWETLAESSILESTLGDHTLSTQRGYRTKGINVLWTDFTNNPYEVKFMVDRAGFPVYNTMAGGLKVDEFFVGDSFVDSIFLGSDLIYGV